MDRLNIAGALIPEHSRALERVREREKRGRAIDTRNDTACVRQEGVENRYREQICRAEHNWSQKCHEYSMVMEDIELDLQSRRKILRAI